jgi:hypothetical protein
MDVALRTVALRLAPFHCAVAPARKYAPLMVIVVEPEPAVTNPGLTLVIVGAGSMTRNEIEFDVPGCAQ